MKKLEVQRFLNGCQDFLKGHHSHCINSINSMNVYIAHFNTNVYNVQFPKYVLPQIPPFFFTHPPRSKWKSLPPPQPGLPKAWVVLHESSWHLTCRPQSLRLNWFSWGEATPSWDVFLYDEKIDVIMCFYRILCRLSWIMWSGEACILFKYVYNIYIYICIHPWTAWCVWELGMS